ncbi:MAG: FAD-dependent oxidoreductase [Eubacteriales bacterium]|nr:FAD-dependent oxidoreductase [Eubacteriales bacterium]
MSKKIVIVGGVAGGATAIARLRRLDEEAEILLLEKGEFVSFANCGLPYYLGGVIKSRDALFVSDIRSIESKYGVKIRNFSEVIAVEPQEKRVRVRDVRTGEEYTESYDSLLLSTGSFPFVPPMEGSDAANVFTLWNIPDTDRIESFVREQKPKRAVVAGGGFIGLEMAENLSERGLQVTLVEFAPQIMPPLDPDMSKLAEDHLREKGVKLLLSTAISAIENNGRTVVLSSGEKLDTDMTLLSIGVRPNTGFLAGSGIELNARGGVIVDEQLRTNIEDIYAVGDMIEVVHGVSGEKSMIPLAGPANKQGRAVAANILGRKPELYRGTIGTSVAKIFDLTVATTGENEKMLAARGLKLWQDYGIALVHPMSHAGYYPGALPMTLKLLFEMKGGRILGGQIVGFEGVDKRIDSIATSIHFKGSVYDLTELELAYAPPFSSAKDPVNMAGYVATNILEGLTEPITYDEWLQVRDQVVTIDVRESIEVANGGVEGAINIPLSQLRSRIKELDPQRSYVVSCAVGLRGYISERILKQKGFKVRNLTGGYRTISARSEASQATGSLQLEQEKLADDSADHIAKAAEPTGVKAVKEVLQLDVCGLSCPGPIVSVSKKMATLQPGERLAVKATDPGFARDIVSWCENTGNLCVERSSDKGVYLAVLEKQEPVAEEAVKCAAAKEKTMIVFDGDLDKAIAAFIIATGSAAMGNQVNMFFTFWGLNILRRPEKQPVKKDFISKMFAAMMPRGSRRLKLSKMNFGGMGSKMMKSVMKKKGISSLEELMAEAQAAGVKLIACQMSMDVMGITEAELIDGVTLGGVATMLNDNDRSNMNLFI